MYVSREGHYQREYQRSPAAVRKKGTSGGIAISFSACDDHQTSASASVSAMNFKPFFSLKYLIEQS